MQNMLPGIKPKDMEKAMKKLGIKQEQIEAEEVIIKTREKDLVIRNPQVTKINMMGQESLQIMGRIEEIEGKEDDVKLIMEQTSCSKDEAIKALEKNDGDIAKAILSFKK